MGRAVAGAGLALALCLSGCTGTRLATAPSGRRESASPVAPHVIPPPTPSPPTALAPTTSPTTTTVPVPAPSTGPPTSAAPTTVASGIPSNPTTLLPAPGSGFIPGKVTAIGDSVMIDYEDDLEADIPGVVVDAAVSRQWTDGEQEALNLKTSGQLGAVVIVGLGTNGTVSASDFATMMSILAGASRIVIVNVHVDQPWQDPDNAVLAAGVASYPNTVLADWASLAAANPQWFGPDGTHLPIDGPGAQALAALIASKV